MASRKQIARRKGVKKSNPRRRKSEFARCYHSKERVAFVKQQPCAWCALRGLVRIPGSSHNAHVVTDGMGRKAGYEAIVPLCARHHAAYDEHRAPFNKPSSRLAVWILARQTEDRWQEQLRRNATPETQSPTGSKGEK